jgi:hypothetical protein
MLKNFGFLRIDPHPHLPESLTSLAMLMATLL